MIYLKFLKYYTLGAVFFVAFLLQGYAQTYQPIKSWSSEINDRIEAYLNETKLIKERKVAVFDYDGTLMGQVPFYMVDEAMIDYTYQVLAHKSDAESKGKVEMMTKMLEGSTSSDEYVDNRVRFLSGMTPELVEDIGYNTFQNKYRDKIYSGMRQLLANLEEFGLEIWIISTSPEVLCQRMIAEEFGIPKDRILGTKASIEQGLLTENLVPPRAADQGKADVIDTYIKAKPLIVGGNSRGDLEMTNRAVGLKIAVNPDNEKVYTEQENKELAGHTLYSYWKEKDAIIVYSEDEEDTTVSFESEKRGVVKNKTVQPE